MHSLYKLTTSRCRLLIGAAGKLRVINNGAIPVHVTSSRRQYSKVSGGTEVFAFPTQGAEEKGLVSDITVLPGGDIVTAHYAGLKRFTIDGQHVWTSSTREGFVPGRVHYNPGADRLCVRISRGLMYWAGLDGTVGERACAMIKYADSVCVRGHHELYVGVTDPKNYVNKGGLVLTVDWKRDEIIGEFQIPMRATFMCCLEDGTVVVNRHDQHQLQAYSPTGELQWKYGTVRAGSGPGKVKYPKGTCAAPGGGLFLADEMNHRVQKISASGKHVCDVITEKDGMLQCPRAVAMNNDGQLFVVQGKGLVSGLNLH